MISAKGILEVFLIYLGFCQSSQVAQNDTENHFTCPKDWTAHEGDCYYVSSVDLPWDSALSSCSHMGGYLVNIPSLARNNFITGLLSDSSAGYWIGLKQDYGTSYYTWRGVGGQATAISVALWNSPPTSGFHYGVRCARMMADGVWYPDQSCSDYKRYICQRSPDCVYGWTGSQCDQVCHCAAAPCGKQHSGCPYGCNPGWTGTLCDTVKQKPEVVYFCQNINGNLSSVLLRIDTRGVSYSGILAVGESGAVQSKCSKADFTASSQPDSLSITIPSEGSDICRGYLVPNTTSTYRWTFWMAEFPGILSDNDYIFSVTCDFTKAETMQRAASTQIVGNTSPQVVPVERSDENVQLMVVSPDTSASLQPITVAKLGTRVRLAMTLALQTGLRAKGISPKDCAVSSSDGAHVMKLTDHHGCPTGKTSVSKFSGKSILQQTEVFSIFTFRDVTDIVISCSFDFCFSENDQNCTDRCTHYMNYRRYRGKRSLPGAGAKKAVAYLHILPPPQTSDNENVEAEIKTSTRSLTVTLLVIVVVAAAMIMTVGCTRIARALDKRRKNYDGWIPLSMTKVN